MEEDKVQTKSKVEKVTRVKNPNRVKAMVDLNNKKKLNNVIQETKYDGTYIIVGTLITVGIISGIVFYNTVGYNKFKDGNAVHVTVSVNKTEDKQPKKFKDF